VKHQKESVLFISDKVFVDYTIPGGVQLCTNEFIDYLETAGYEVNLIKVSPKITFLRKIRRKLQIETYEFYDIDQWLSDIVEIIRSRQIKLVFFNQVNLAHWSAAIKPQISVDVKFIGLSHGNESGDYLHDITQTPITSILKTWRLGKYLVKEKAIFSTHLDAVVTISENERYIDQWLGAQNTFYLPRILKNDFLDWHPIPNTIGFVGTLNHLPNFKGIDQLAICLQQQHFKGILKLVGSPDQTGKLLAEKYPFIRYIGALTPQQLAAEASTWCLFLNPVFWYARGSSTKLSQAFNWGLPVATTLAGARGYDLSNSASVINSNEPAEMAELIINTLNSENAIDTLKQISEENTLQFNLAVWATRLKAFLDHIKKR